MRILTGYILKQTLIPFFATIFLFLMALSLERLLRLVDEITAHNASLTKALELLAYLLPHYLGLAIPAALFISTMLAVRHFYDHAELNVMRATGHNIQTLQKPILGLSILMSLILIILSGYAQPHARYEYRAKLNEIKSAPKTIQIRAKTFQDFGEDKIIYADTATPSENYLGGFFASFTDQLGLKTYITAEHAYIEQGTNEQKLTLNLLNGQIIKNPKKRDPQFIKFETYPWQPQISASEYGVRGQDERELTLNELISPDIQNENAAQDAYRAEFHARLVHAFSLPFLCLLAIPLALIGQGRTSKAGGIVIGVIGLIAYEKLLGFGEAFASAGTISPYISLWVPFILIGILSLIVLSKQERHI